MMGFKNKKGGKGKEKKKYLNIFFNSQNKEIT
jgi:hypothetical protein